MNENEPLKDQPISSHPKSFLQELEQSENSFFAKNIPTIIAIILVTIGFASLLFYSYKYNDKSSQEIPLIKADSEPIKVKPLDPGGMIVPNMDKSVYNNLTQKKSDNLPKVERILPLPEEPIDKSNLIESYKEEQEVQTSVTKDSTKKSIEHENTNPANNDDLLEVLDKEINSPEKEDNKEQEPDKNFIKPLPANQKNKLAIIKPSAEKLQTSKYKIQLASFKTEKEALKEWKKIKNSHPAILSKLEPYVTQKNIASKGVYYRLQAGPIANDADARLLCQKLSKLHQACIVVKD